MVLRRAAACRMVGGGRRRLHRRRAPLAMRLDDKIALVAGRALVPIAATSRFGAKSGSLPSAAMPTTARWRTAEAARPDGIEAVVIVTPNHLHAPIATAFSRPASIVICDKPLVDDLAEAEALVTARAGGRRLLVTLDNTVLGARWTRQRDGALRASLAARRRAWRLRPGLADAADRRRWPKQAEWRTDPARAGQSAVLADIGVHRQGWPASFRVGRPRGRRRSVHGDAAGGSTTTRMCWCAGRRGARGTILAGGPRPATTTTFGPPLRREGRVEVGATRPEELRFSPYGGARSCAAGTARAGGREVSRMPAAPGRLYRGLPNFYRDAADIIRTPPGARSSAQPRSVPDVMGRAA